MKNLFLFILLISVQTSVGQDAEYKDYVHLQGNVFDFAGNETLDFFEVRVILDTDIIITERYYDTQEFNLKLPYGLDYTVIFFSKNYASRKVLVDLVDITFANKKIYNLELELGLLEKRKGVKTKDISKSYSGIARYSPTRDSVEWLAKQKERIDKLISNRITANNQKEKEKQTR